MKGLFRAGGLGCPLVQPALARGAGGQEMPDLFTSCGYPRGKENSHRIVVSPLLPVFTFPAPSAPCSNAELLMTLNKLISGLNSLREARPGVRGQLSIPD